MRLNMLKGKIHRATVKQAALDYVGSITIDVDLLEASGIIEYEKVQNKKSTNDSTNISNENVHKNNNVTKESLLLQIEQLRGIITKLQNEIARKDSIIESQKEDKMKLTKRVEELEKMLSSFLALENPKLSNINK